MTDLVALREQVARITPVNEREVRSIELTIERLSWPDDPFDEACNDHHLTASAFVVSRRGMILHRHLRLDIWVQPGGHVDPGERPEEAAVRETLEETGLPARHLEPVVLFQVDVHPGPRGHTHYDLRYVLAAAPDDPAPPLGESPDVHWFDFVAAPVRAEPTLAPVIAKLAAMLRTGDVGDFGGE